MTTVCLLSSLISKCFSKPCGTFRKTLQHDEELSKIAQPRQSGINREKKSMETQTLTFLVVMRKTSY